MNRPIVNVCVVLAALLVLGGVSLQLPQVTAWTNPDLSPRSEKAPIVISGDNVYVVWFTDKGTPNSNGEVIFRASDDGGATFGDKINLSNTNDTDSINAEIAAEGDNVIVTWWERTNATSNQPVLRISTDNGQTFSPLVQVAINGTISSNVASAEN